MMRQNKLFNITAELHRKINVQNPGGGWAEKWSKIADIRCRISTYSTPRDVEKVEQARQQFPTTHRVYTPPDSPIKFDDRVFYRDVYYEVKYIENPSMLDHHLECFAEVILPGEVKAGAANG